MFDASIVTTVLTGLGILLGVWRMAEGVRRDLRVEIHALARRVDTLADRVNALTERFSALAERVAAIEGALNGRFSRPYSMEGVQTREQKD